MTEAKVKIKEAQTVACALLQKKLSLQVKETLLHWETRRRNENAETKRFCSLHCFLHVYVVNSDKDVKWGIK